MNLSVAFVAVLSLAERVHGLRHGNGEKTHAMPPTNDHCESNGGTVESPRHTKTGDEYALCVFDDGSACDTWWYFRGECEKGAHPVFSRYCDRSGGELSDEDVDWEHIIGASPAEYEVCTFANGTECEEYNYYVGGCATNHTHFGLRDGEFFGKGIEASPS